MTHPDLRNPDRAGEYWWDELAPGFGSADIVDTADKPAFGKANKAKPKHKLEATLPRFQDKERAKFAGTKKLTLALKFTQPDKDESRFTLILGGILFVVEKVPLSKKWRAFAEYRQWETPTVIADDPATALKILCAWPHWFLHIDSMSHWGLIAGRHSIGLYANVHFVFPFGKRKKLPKAYIDTLDCSHANGFLMAQPKPYGKDKPRPAAPKFGPISKVTLNKPYTHGTATPAPALHVPTFMDAMRPEDWLTAEELATPNLDVKATAELRQLYWKYKREGKL